jgi:hypothetical protein
VRGAWRWLMVLGAACSSGRATSALPSPEPDFRVLGEPRPGEANGLHIEVSGRAVVIRGIAPRLEGGELHGEFDLSQAGTVRLTLYDSLPGRPVDAAPPADAPYRSVRYEARIGPLPAGVYDVVVGHYDPRAQLVVVSGAPVRVQVKDRDASG